jgi:hypothetical protein
VGTLQATEVIKEITGVGDSLAGRLLIYDARGPRFETISLAWDPDNPLTGRGGRGAAEDPLEHDRVRPYQSDA